MPFTNSSKRASFENLIPKCPKEIKLLSQPIPSIKHTRENVETNDGSLRTDLAFPTNTADTRGCSLHGRH